jgi:molybdopterin molybdotransferase
MLTLDEALQRLADGTSAQRITATETVSTFDALGRVLAADVRSAIDVPPADNTSMDGYALRTADVPAAGTVLRVAQRIPAGHVGQPLEPGTAARIFTGGQVPAGADPNALTGGAAPPRGRCGGDAGAVRSHGG